MIIHYQPIVEIDSGDTVRVEAFTRVENRGNHLDAATFIAQAEANGLIRHVTTKVVELVLADRDVFGRTVPLSFNVSEPSLRDPEFSTWFLGAMTDAAVDLTSVTLEFPDGVQGSASDAARATMRRLRERGVRFSIDGFGLDLSQWSHIEIEKSGVVEVKIHADIIANFRSSQSRVLMGSVMDIADRFHLDVVAKNVESLEHIAGARELGCRFAQGYAITRPMAAAELGSWLADRTVRAMLQPPPVAPSAPPQPSSLANAFRFFRR